jgi:transcriptional regulator with XRE-family HTH domain
MEFTVRLAGANRVDKFPYFYFFILLI